LQTTTRGEADREEAIVLGRMYIRQKIKKKLRIIIELRRRVLIIIEKITLHSLFILAASLIIIAK